MYYETAWMFVFRYPVRSQSSDANANARNTTRISHLLTQLIALARVACVSIVIRRDSTQ